MSRESHVLGGSWQDCRTRNGVYVKSDAHIKSGCSTNTSRNVPFRSKDSNAMSSRFRKLGSLQR
jgi:hypothetical protein